MSGERLSFKNPNLQSFYNTLLDARKKGLFLSAFLNCEITYKGRAEAFLPRGDRLLVLKQDGVLLIHQPVNGVPINYLKSGSVISLKRVKPGYQQSSDKESCERSGERSDKEHGQEPDGEILLISAKSSDGKEFLDIAVYDSYGMLFKKLSDGQKQLLAGNEADMSDMIRDNPEIISKDFKPLSREEHTKVGFIDVFGHDGKGNLIVVECKRYTASLSCVTQLKRYVDKLKKIKNTENVTGVMASPGITPNAEQLLKEWGFRWVRVDPPKRLVVNKDQKSLFEF